MNSPRSLISTSSSGGIRIGVADSELVQRTRCSADPICVALTTMSHVACGTIAGQLCGDSLGNCARPRVITQSLIQMPGHRRRSAIAPRLPIVPPPAYPSAYPSAPGLARNRTDVDACSCAWHHCRSWQRVSLTECQSECQCEYSLWTVGNTLRVWLERRLRLRLGLANEFNAAFRFRLLLFVHIAHCCVAFFALFVRRFCARVMRIYDICVYASSARTLTPCSLSPSPSSMQRTASPVPSATQPGFGLVWFGFVWVSLW